MKTFLPEQITSVEEAKVFLTELYNNHEAYHPEDDAFSLVGYVCSTEEAHRLNKLMSDIYKLPENQVEDRTKIGFCPCEFILNLDPEYVEMMNEISEDE